MAFEVLFTDLARKDWEKLDHSIQVRISKSIDKLSSHPTDLGKPLSGKLSGSYRIRVGDFRIVYRVIHSRKLVEVWVICHRKEVYKLAERRVV